MGQTLSEPVTEKQSSTCQDARFLVGSSCMQGWRVSMDDSHTHILSLPDDPGTAFFAVYDGHGGSNIAEYAGKHLHKFITARPEYHLGNIEEALKQGFLDLDQAMLEEDMLQEKVAGSTAVVVLIKDNTLYCANVGDSRAIASVRGAVESLSFDHKPNNEEELRRITAGGGWVQLNRVNGNLALSRALGDYVFKRNYRASPQEQIVTAYPDVQVRQLNEDWEFIVIACDGIWEVLSNEEVISFCRARLLRGWEPAMVCEALMQRCLAPNCATGGLGCDNMTVLIICLSPFPRVDAMIDERRLHARKSMSHCRIPPEPSVRARTRNERSLFNSIGRCVRVEERQRPHTTYTELFCQLFIKRELEFTAFNLKEKANQQNGSFYLKFYRGKLKEADALDPSVKSIDIEPISPFMSRMEELSYIEDEEEDLK
ncbi:Probable protein phosphatase 2C T23F11.1 [Eumeta japonica]|uniref:protein-serine/threonine phosphatase n=1 Tax=Eumeta variegata TaxID=151549 RepID=A0A4C1TUX4_EUMVA|nr:Probable protein phosphatase 2C T23F11.1 [Eumeta japonica]